MWRAGFGVQGLELEKLCPQSIDSREACNAALGPLSIDALPAPASRLPSISVLLGAVARHAKQVLTCWRIRPTVRTLPVSEGQAIR